MVVYSVESIQSVPKFNDKFQDSKWYKLSRNIIVLLRNVVYIWHGFRSDFLYGQQKRRTKY